MNHDLQELADRTRCYCQFRALLGKIFNALVVSLPVSSRQTNKQSKNSEQYSLQHLNSPVEKKQNKIHIFCEQDL